MTVMTPSPKKSESKEQEMAGKKQPKPRDKTRPITATLDHPLILDIKLLKKLDMTTFTKKGLIALSKFCGISLVDRTTDKRKSIKWVKTVQHSKKQAGGEGKGALSKCPALESNKRDLRPRRKAGKQGSRAKPRIRFKATDEGGSPPEEDSSDVVCRRHERARGPHPGATERKAMLEEILDASIENVVPEPCKTCSRSEHPERFHSHPKMATKLTPSQSTERNLEERFKDALTTKDGSKNLSAKSNDGDHPQDRRRTPSPGKPPRKAVSKSPTKSNSSAGLSSPEAANKGKPKNLKKPLPSSEKKSLNEVPYLKKTASLRNAKNEEDRLAISPVEETMKFVTGCYVCGRQVSPKSRIKHEESCIAEWRTQNNLLSPNERKPEPKRPDFRFTAAGDLDCEGTFESIWANHKDSLVPCKKCGRRFFPDRIERHENCCNSIPLSVKYKH